MQTKYLFLGVLLFSSMGKWKFLSGLLNYNLCSAVFIRADDDEDEAAVGAAAGVKGAVALDAKKAAGAGAGAAANATAKGEKAAKGGEDLLSKIYEGVQSIIATLAKGSSSNATVSSNATAEVPAAAPKKKGDKKKSKAKAVEEAEE